MLKWTVVTIVLLVGFAVAADTAKMLDAHFMNTSGFDASLSVDGKPAVDCQQGGMCDFKITGGKHAFHATLGKGGASSGEFTIPGDFKMLCVAIYPNKVMDFSNCGQ
jgi:hypothetical protein